MDKNLKILIISNTPWDDNNSFGSSFSNIYGGKLNYEIANIYCQFGTPNTKVVKHFFQITEKGILKSLFVSNYQSGNIIQNSENVSNPLKSLTDKELKYFNLLKILRWQIFFWLRDLIWSTGKWKSKGLYDFINNFKPDLVFLPIYYSSYLNNIGLYAKKISGVKMVGYISDDCYTFKQFSLSPFFWIDRFVKRIYIKKAIENCEILYTITEKQKYEYNKIFGNKCKLLFKGGEFNDFPNYKNDYKKPIKIVYTGNLGMGRWKTLVKIGNALMKINENNIKVQMDVYSNTPLSKYQKKLLNIKSSVYFKGSVSFSEIKEIHEKADILVHVESFKLSERYSARLSFSTKIVDYLESKRCILAIGWSETGAIEYLIKNDAAYVITNVNQLFNKLSLLINDEELIKMYAKKGFELGKKNHNINQIRNMLYDDLVKVSGVFG